MINNVLVIIVDHKVSSLANRDGAEILRQGVQRKVDADHADEISRGVGIRRHHGDDQVAGGGVLIGGGQDVVAGVLLQKLIPDSARDVKGPVRNVAVGLHVLAVFHAGQPHALHRVAADGGGLLQILQRLLIIFRRLKAIAGRLPLHLAEDLLHGGLSADKRLAHEIGLEILLDLLGGVLQLGLDVLVFQAVNRGRGHHHEHDRQKGQNDARGDRHVQDQLSADAQPARPGSFCLYLLFLLGFLTFTRNEHT